MATNYEISDVELESPLLNAAGSINGTSEENILREVELLADTGIGAITVGSFTIPCQEGNEAKFGTPTYYHNCFNRKTYNAMGLPNIGIIAAQKLMPEIVNRAHDKGKPVIASVSSTLHTDEIGDSKIQLARLVYEMLLTDVDLIEVNTSSPNTVTADGGRKPIIGYDLEAMQEVVVELIIWAGIANSKVGFKLPPYLTDEEREVAAGLASVLRKEKIFGFVTTSNTIGGQIPLDANGNHILSVPGGMGGMSGPATKPIGRDQLTMWHDLMGDEMDIVSTLGVDSGEELKTRLQLGAVAAGGVTFLWESKNWQKAVTQTLLDFANK